MALSETPLRELTEAETEIVFKMACARYPLSYSIADVSEKAKADGINVQEKRMRWASGYRAALSNTLSSADIDHLQRENEQLRQALESIKRSSEGEMATWLDCTVRINHIATAALNYQPVVAATQKEENE